MFNGLTSKVSQVLHFQASMGKRHRHRRRHDSGDEEDEKSRKKRRSRYDTDSESEGDQSASFSSPSASSEEYRRRKRREKKKKKHKEKEEKRHEKKKRKKEHKEKAAKGPVTESWGKFGIIKEIDMWTKRPEFSAWLGEVKQVNMETLPAWEEKQMFKEYMEDYNTATFPSKKYYDLDLYHRRKMMKEIEKGTRKAIQAERTVFNDEEQRRLELRRERDQQKEAEIEALKHSMQSGMAKAMREQAQLREEMNYQFRLGNFEAAAAIQKRLDPDINP